MNLLDELIHNTTEKFLAAHICDGFCPEFIREKCSYRELSDKIRCIEAQISEWEEE